MSLSPCKWVSWDETGRPSCKHGAAVSAGGWRCVEKYRESRRKYIASEKGREKAREHGRKYRATEKGREKARARARKYRATDKGRETQRLRNARQIRVGDMYLGVMGFTKAETEAIVNGTTD